MNRKKIFSIFLSLSLSFLIFLFHEKSYAGLFGGYVPEGKEIKDPYLEKLFAPEFSNESIRVIETREGKRYIVVKAKEKVIEKIRLNYEKNTLRNRGIVVLREGSPRTDILMISEMRLYRVVSEIPYVVEYSEVKGDKLGREAENVVRNEGKYLIVLINKNFGKVFKRVEIYPEKETKCPEPPFVGKYPNSKSVSCTAGNKWISFVYVTKDKGQEIYDYYRERLKTHYKNVGFNFPERAWKFGDEFGIQINSSEVAKVRNYLDPAEKNASIKAPVPSNGVVFHIVITEIGLKPIIQNYSLIKVFYCLDLEKINTNIQQMKTIYPEGVKQ
jgi:hypothetical protein